MNIENTNATPETTEQQIHPVIVTVYQLRNEGEETHCETMNTFKFDNIGGFDALENDLYCIESEDSAETAPEYAVFLTAPDAEGRQFEICIHRIAVMQMAKFIKEETDDAEQRKLLKAPCSDQVS